MRIKIFILYMTNILQTYMESHSIIRISLDEYGVREEGLARRIKYLMSQCWQGLTYPFNIKDEFVKRTGMFWVYWMQPCIQ